MSSTAMNGDSTVLERGHKIKKTKYKMKSVVKKLCKVCGDRANKQHFGVLACENCKNFYRGSLNKAKRFKCRGNEDHCIPSFRSAAENCQLCWLKKCELRGMSRLAVKISRRKFARCLPTKTPYAAKVLARAYFQSFRRCEQRIRTNRIKPLLLSDAPLEKSLSSYKAAMFSQLCSHYQLLVNDIVRFSQLIPGFGKLPPDDQLILLKTGFIDVWLIVNATRLTLVQDSITLSDGTQIPICEVTTIYTKEYVTSIMELSDEFKSLKLLPSDRALLIALALSCADRPNLLESDQVKELQQSLISDMKKYVRLTRPNSPEFCRKLLSLLANIYDIGKQHSLLLNVYRADVRVLTVTPVITELFDLHPLQAYKES